MTVWVVVKFPVRLAVISIHAAVPLYHKYLQAQKWPCFYKALDSWHRAQQPKYLSGREYLHGHAQGLQNCTPTQPVVTKGWISTDNTTIIMETAP